MDLERFDVASQEPETARDLLFRLLACDMSNHTERL